MIVSRRIVVIKIDKYLINVGIQITYVSSEVFVLAVISHHFGLAHMRRREYY